MSDRTAPSGGYDFGNKRQYRRDVWTDASILCRHKKESAQCLLMPSIEGDEIEIAESYGFKQSNMHVVDKNPAIVATLKRRYPRINTYGVDLAKAVKRISQSGIKLSVANYDLCSNIEGVVRCLRMFQEEDVYDEHALVAVNVMRGRERDINSIDEGILADAHDEMDRRLSNVIKWNSAVSKCLPRDKERVARVWSSLPMGEFKFIIDKSPKIYQSNRVTMLWVGICYIPLLRHGYVCPCLFCVNWWPNHSHISKKQYLRGVKYVRAIHERAQPAQN